MNQGEWCERMRRYERALAAFILAGSLVAVEVPGDHREYHILHPESGYVVTLDLTSPAVTGAALP